ncbi:MAG: exosortase B [Burkholderiales bacterium]|nr:exosortase B [Burkholderiales bacterium]
MAAGERTQAVGVQSGPAAWPLPLLVLLVLGFAALYLPSYWSLSKTVWPSDEQGHGPIILAVAGWLLWKARADFLAAPIKPMPWLGWPTLLVALLFYAFGRSQDILLFEVASQIFVLIALTLIFHGPKGLRVIWFPLFFLLFMVPLPEVLVTAVTTPLKSAVSAVASQILYLIGYPVGRMGVILTVGPYQLLVADACAGLNSMFTLEALGLLYMNLMNYTSAARNITLAVLLIPISFAANIVRVMILVLVTYHFGDEAGQGFVHGFAGMVLFMVALVLMLVVDKLLNFVFPTGRAAAAPKEQAA